MRILISTDYHFGKSQGLYDNIILNGIKEICKFAKEHDIKYMINLGDILDTKQSLLTSSLNKLAEGFELINDTFEKTWIIIGNHDLNGKDYFNKKNHNLHILNAYPNIEIIDEPTILELDNKKLFLLPYYPTDIIKKINFEDADYLLGHIEVRGFMLAPNYISEGINPHDLTKYKKVILGHFHKRQSNYNVHYIGNLVRFFYGENDQPRGWAVLDLENDELEYYNYENQPALYKIKYTELNEEFLNKLKKGDKLKLIIDKNISYEELNKLKNKLFLDYNIGELKIEEEYFIYDVDSIVENEEDENDELMENNLDNISYIDFVLMELQKVENINDGDEILDLVKEIKQEMNLE
jgi:DNA repair exonuclease SbcCD nuclease subunit